ncbi:hypothetical protein DUI87_16904 [Hirundo rustica rustica]|uniref:Uncharacterized protein n=1 Tax=Hirundo rustica rustica TaxID=333673 RepID=A0A3M0K2F6_HIRRU|nr:hypothetical protein DUI87_16904 [Hirundo rustica rustica]
MKFTKAESQSNPKHKYRLGREWLESNPGENLGALADEKLNLSQACELASQKANHILDCMKSTMNSRLKEAILHSHEISPGPLHPAL